MSALGFDAGSGPLPCGPGPTLASDSRHVGEAPLPPVFTRDILEQGAPSAASFASLSASSLPSTPWWAATHLRVISLSLPLMRSQTAIAAMAKRCPGPGASVFTRSSAAVEPAKMV